MAAMEQWSWPPSYDDSYMPDPSSRHWFKERETMNPSDREAAILTRLQDVCAYAYAHAPFYRCKWDEAGFHPSQLKSLEDFESRVPVVKKAELRASQEAHPPFGEYLCVPEHEVARVHGTSGTTGRPTAFGISTQDWKSISNAHARVMWAMGMRPGDKICVAAIFSLYMGSWGALGGTERLRATAFPFGAGAAGMSSRCAQWLDILKPAGFYGTPTYAIHLAETAIKDGRDPREFGLKYMFFSGEPGASIPSIRGRIEELYGAKVHDSGSMGEMTPWMHVGGSKETPGMLCWQDIVYTEVCDPATHHRVPYGQRGTPVYTHLERTSQPMIRFESGDLTVWTNDATPCGRTYPQLPMGIIGRIDDMITIRGENVYPSEIEAALTQLPGYGGEHRIYISREDAMDELMISVEIGSEGWAKGEDSHKAFEATVAMQLHNMLGLRSVIEIVAPNTHEHTDFKAKRVVDDRSAFAEMHARHLEASS